MAKHQDFHLSGVVKENKQNKLTAKNFKANMIEEQAEATEELIAALTEKHTQQIEMLIKNNTKAMREMMSHIKNTTKNSQVVRQMRKRRRVKKKDAKNTTMHLFARIAERNTQLKKKTNAGSSKRTKTPAHPIGSQLKVRGAHGNRDVSVKDSDIE